MDAGCPVLIRKMYFTDSQVLDNNGISDWTVLCPSQTLVWAYRMKFGKRWCAEAACHYNFSFLAGRQPFLLTTPVQYALE